MTGLSELDKKSDSGF